VPPTASDIFDLLGRRGQRLTRARRAVIESLLAAGGPASVRDLHAAAASVDLVTVYRALHWLVELGLARQVPGGPAGELFELVGEEAHTHHLRCDLCGRMWTVPVCGIPRSTFDTIQRDYGFTVTDHRLTFHGTCQECRERG
jgi:Fur family ferric uptake transcriptional regulator